MMRTAAGRRALQVVLLVGGLFALGFLCGEQAHAAEAAPTLSSATSEATSSEATSSGKAPLFGQADPAGAVRSLVGSTLGTVDRLTQAPTAAAAEPNPATPADPKPAHPANPKPAPPAAPAPASNPAPAPHHPAPSHPVTKSPSHPSTDSGFLTGALTEPGAADPVLGSLTDQLVRTVGERVVQPVGDLVETVTAGLGQVTAQIPPLESLPAVPLPGTPSVPVPPSLPGVPALPGHTLPAPVVQAPQSGDAGHAAEAAVDERRSAAGASGAAFGPQLGTDIGQAVAGTTRVQRAAAAGRVPARPHQAPDGDPADELVSHAAVDNGNSRHGDAHAVTLNHRTPVLFVAGSAARSDAAGTRDRHRDIPVFPG